MIPLIVDAGLKLIDKIIPDKKAADAAKLELLKQQQDGQFRELEIAMQAIVAEATSEDPYTSRARPSFMYTFYFILLTLVVVAPAIGMIYPQQLGIFFANVGAGFEAVPEPLWWTFTAGYLGYTGARTYEKRSNISK